MDKREQIIRLWFSMWLEKKDLGMDDIFAENVSYTESWGPCYSNRETVKHWFQEYVPPCIWYPLNRTASG